MYEIMYDLDDNRLEAIYWIGHLRFLSILFFFAYFPNLCRLHLSLWDAGGIGFCIPYFYYIYLKYKEYKDA